MDKVAESGIASHWQYKTGAHSEMGSEARAREWLKNLVELQEGSDSQEFVESLKLDLALFNTEGAVYRRMLVDMAPVRPAKTIVKTFSTEGDCAQLGSLLVNEVTACQPGDPATCQDQLSLSSRVKNVKFFK